MPPSLSAELIAAIVAPLAERTEEVFVVLYFNGANELVATRHIRGDHEAVEVPIRRIAVDALAVDARAAIVAHNHPGGEAEASADDLAFTRRLELGLGAIDVALVEHLIVARGGRSTSLRAKGYL